MEAGTKKLKLVTGFVALGVTLALGISILELLHFVFPGATNAEAVWVLVPACSTIIGLQVAESYAKRLAAKKEPASKEEER